MVTDFSGAYNFINIFLSIYSVNYYYMMLSCLDGVENPLGVRLGNYDEFNV
jgi:hypothetical protein